MPLAVAGLLLALPQWRTLLPLYLFLFAALLALLLTLVTWRYRIGLVLVLWPMAAYALIRRGRRQRGDAWEP